MKQYRLHVPGMPANSPEERLYLSADVEPDDEARQACASAMLAASSGDLVKGVVNNPKLPAKPRKS